MDSETKEGQEGLGAGGALCLCEWLSGVGWEEKTEVLSRNKERWEPKYRGEESMAQSGKVSGPMWLHWKFRQGEYQLIL